MCVDSFLFCSMQIPQKTTEKWNNEGLGHWKQLCTAVAHTSANNINLVYDFWQSIILQPIQRKMNRDIWTSHWDRDDKYADEVCTSLHTIDNSASAAKLISEIDGCFEKKWWIPTNYVATMINWMAFFIEMYENMMLDSLSSSVYELL